MIEDALEDDDQTDCKGERYLQDKLSLVTGEKFAGLGDNTGQRAHTGQHTLTSAQLRFLLLHEYSSLIPKSITDGNV